MKYFFLLACFIIIFCFSSVAQDSATTNSQTDTIFKKVEIESEFPGGLKAWAGFLQKNLNYPGKAVRKKIEGVVVVQFIVDEKGKVSGIEAISGPELLHEAAVEVIRKSPAWIPASDNGKKVRSYKKQPIAFRLN